MTPDPRLTRRKLLATTSIGAAAATIGTVADSPVSRQAQAEAVPPRLDPRHTSEVELSINGDRHELVLDNRTSVLDLLRENLQLTGTKKGCDHGACGACTVLVDGRRALACLTLAVRCDGAEITTVEGLATGDELHPLQEAFIRHDAFQCGYCTPGQLMSGVGCLREGRTGSRAEIQEWMSGNLCRCGCYVKIVAAIEDVAGKRG